MKTVTVTISGQTLTGTASDMDSLYIAGLLLPDLSKIQEKEAGLRQSFNTFSKQHAKLLAEAKDPKKAKVLEDEMFEAWGERLLIRLTNNLAIRSSFAQRVTEIFPDINSSLVSYDRWTDRQGNVHDRSSVRLDMIEAMTLVTAIADMTDGKPKSKAKGFAATLPAEPSTAIDVDVEPEAEPDEASDKQAEIDRLKAQIAELELA